MSIELINNIGKYFKSNVFLDLGSKNIRLFDVDNNYSIKDYSAVTILEHRGELSVLDVGKNSHFMRGKTPKNQKIVYPIQNGVISDFDISFLMLEHFFKGMMKNHPNKFFKPNSNIIASVPLAAGKMNETNFQDLLMKVGGAEITLIPQSLAAWIGINKEEYNIDNNKLNVLIHFGAETLEFITVINNEICSSKSFEVGGEDYTKAIMQYFEQNYGYSFSYSVAEEIKTTFLNCSSEDANSKSFSGIVKNSLKVEDIMISEIDCYRAIFGLLKDFFSEFCKFFREELTIDAKTDVGSLTVYLTGGGCLMKNFDTLLRTTLGINFQVVDSPETKVIEGLILCQKM